MAKYLEIAKSFFRKGLKLGKTRPEPMETLLAPAAFEEALRLERARFDRGGMPFTLMVFDIGLPREDRAHLQAVWVLTAALKEHTRSIDAKGWFQERIAVILTNTDPARTTRVWNAVEAAFKQRGSSSSEAGAGSAVNLKHELYAYPGDGKSRGVGEFSKGLWGR